eukprot:SM000080S22945  [mRNA]  locus=s80:266561:267005:- [translate_table: standard]
MLMAGYGAQPDAAKVRPPFQALSASRLATEFHSCAVLAQVGGQVRHGRPRAALAAGSRGWRRTAAAAVSWWCPLMETTNLHGESQPSLV